MDEGTRRYIYDLFGYKQVDFSMSFRYLGFNLKPNGYGKTDWVGSLEGFTRGLTGGLTVFCLWVGN